MFHTKNDLECDAVVFQLQHQNDVSRGKELEWNAVGKDSLPFKVWRKELWAQMKPLQATEQMLYLPNKSASDNRIRFIIDNYLSSDNIVI